MGCECRAATEIKWKRIKTHATLPSKSTKGAACYDAYLPENCTLVPGEIKIVPLGFSVEVPANYELQVRARSGLASKGILVANGVGCVDSDYRGEVGVILFNCSGMPVLFNQGDRICQLKLSYAPVVQWTIVDEIEETDRTGGFGSTGLNDTKETAND